MLRVLDTETTDNRPTAEVVEIGWTDVKRHGDGWEVGETQAHIVDPGVPIEFGAMGTHHITDEMVKGAPLLSQIIRNHDVFAADFIEAFVAHKADFEQSLLVTPAEIPWICTWKVAMRLAPTLTTHSNQGLRYALKLALDPERASPPHRAGPDSYVTAHILVRALTKLTVADMIDITKQPALLYRCPINAALIGAGRNDPKQKDLTFDQIDAGYLRWIIDNVRDNEDLLFTAKTELERRASGRMRMEAT